PSANAIDEESGGVKMGACRERLSRMVSRGSLLVFGVVYIAMILIPMRTRQDFFERGVWIFAAYCVIAAYDFHPWYILWVMALATLMQRTRVMLWVGLCAVFVLYVPMGWKEVIVMAFGPLGAALAMEVGRRFQRSPSWGVARDGAVEVVGATG